MTRRRSSFAVVVSTLVMLGASGAARADGIPLQRVLDISPSGDLQQRYDDARTIEPLIVTPTGTDACADATAGAKRYLRFVRRSVEWFDRGPSPVFGALSTSMQAGAATARRPLEHTACKVLAAATPRNLPTDQPAPLSIWDRRITVYAPPAASTATIRIDGIELGSTTVADHRVNALGPALKPGAHLLRIDFRDEAGTYLGTQFRQGVIALPASAFDRAAADRSADGATSTKLENLRSGTGGTTAAYILDLPTGTEACTATSGDRFPAASLLKLPIMEAAFATNEQEARAYDIATIGGWSSNVAATRLISLVGDGTVNEWMRSMGATSSTFSGRYNVGTAAPSERSTCHTSGAQVGTSSKLTTAYDVAMMLRYVTIGGTTDATPAGRRILSALVGSERSADNRGIGLDVLDGSTVAAIKNGWIDNDLYHTAAVLFLESGPRIVVTLTSGIDRAAADAFAHGVFSAALQMQPPAVGSTGEGT